MRLIYLIDPYGFANYVQLYADEIHKGDILSIVNLKDSIYTTLFNISPQYYRRTPSGTWYIASGPTDSTDVLTVLSESEFIFGTHPIYDANTLLQLGSILIELIGLRIDNLNLSNANIQNALEAFHKFFSLTYSLGQSVIEDDFFSYIRDFAVDEITEDELDEYKSNNYSMSWAYDLFSLSSSFEEAANRISDKPTFYKDIFDYCVVEPNYRLFIGNRTDETEYIGEIREILGE